MSNKIDDETLAEILLNINIARDKLQDLWRHHYGLEIDFPHLKEWIERAIESAHTELVEAHNKLLAISPPDVVEEISEVVVSLDFFKDEE